ncbi:MAG: hypothetical protein ACQGQP_04700 [Desulfovibrio sp.]|nr:hypothetical protein [Mailhella sp.]
MDDRGNARKKDRRPFQRKGDIRAEGDPGKNAFSGIRKSRESDLEELMELDGEIIHLVMKRTQLLARFVKNGRISPEKEKSLRTSWESRAARMGRDARLSRELFVLLQSLEPFSRTEDGRSYFNLDPCQDPVDIRLTAPASAKHALLFLAASAASGQAVKLDGLCLTDEVIDGIKALNQLGGQIRWEENGDAVSAPGGGIGVNFDRVIHAGSSPLCLWLLFGLCAGQTSHAKITGDGSFLVDLSAVRRFMPRLGVRLTNVIPSQKGLPVRLECSGMIPEKVLLDEDLPPDFCAILVFCSAFWKRRCTFQLPERSLPMLPLVEEILQGCGVRLFRQGRDAWTESDGVSLPEHPAIPMDVAVASSLLMLPGFNGGICALKGAWGKGSSHALAAGILRTAGLDVSFGAEEAVCSGKIRETKAPSDETLKRVVEECPELLPLCAVVMAAAVMEGEEVSLSLPECEDRFTLAHFLSYCGISEENGMLGSAGEGEAPRDSWIAPSPAWAMAFALCSFLVPRLRLSNPHVVSLLYPQFWSVYNGLPHPRIKSRTEEKEEKEDAAAPARRRVIAKGAFGELPAPIARDDF